MDMIELEDARSAFEDGGANQLQSYLARLDHKFGGKHYLLDASGKEVNGEESLAYLLPPPPLRMSRGEKDKVGYLTQLSDDGRYWFVATETTRLWQLAIAASVRPALPSELRFRSLHSSALHLVAAGFTPFFGAVSQALCELGGFGTDQ